MERKVEPRASSQGCRAVDSNMLSSYFSHIFVPLAADVCKAPLLLGSSLPCVPQKGSGCSRMPGLTVASPLPRHISHLPEVAAWLGVHQIFPSSSKCSWSALGHILPSDKSNFVLHIGHITIFGRFCPSISSNLPHHHLLFSLFGQSTQWLVRVICF